MSSVHVTRHSVQVDSKDDVTKIFNDVVKSAKTKDGKRHRRETAYDFNHYYRGLAVIISNGNFSKSSERPYYLKELEMMKAVFEKLEFTTVCFHDLTAKQIEWVFDEVSRQEDFNMKSDCFACVIASHGNEKPRPLTKPRDKVYLRDHCLYGRDEDTVTTKSVIEKISEVDELKNKPKLFFIQACRSRPDKPRDTSMEHGFDIILDNKKETFPICEYKPSSAQPSDGDSKHADTEEINFLIKLFQRQQEKPKEIIRILDPPCKEDCLVVYSSSSEKASFGRDGVGGWMLYSLSEAVKNLLSDAKMSGETQIELFSVLTELNNIMTKKFETNFGSGERRKAVSAFEHRMLSEIWF